MPPVVTPIRRTRHSRRSSLVAAVSDHSTAEKPRLSPTDILKARDIQERIYELRRVSPIIRYYGDFKWNLAFNTAVMPGKREDGDTKQLGTMDTSTGEVEYSSEEKRVLKVYQSIPDAQRTIAELVMQRALVGEAAVVWQRTGSDPFEPVVRSVIETKITDDAVEYVRPSGKATKYKRAEFGQDTPADLRSDYRGIAVPFTSLRPSADYHSEPDSPLFSIIHLIEELYALQLTMLAVVQSQTPAYLAMLNADAIRSEEDQDAFEEEWFEQLAGSIENPGSGGSIIPFPVWIPGMYMRDEEKFIDILQVARKIDPNLTEREGEILNRAAVALNMRMETFTGFANVKYSNAIVITRDEFRSHFEPEFRDALNDWEKIVWVPHAKKNNLKPENWPLTYITDAVIADPDIAEKLTKGVEIGAVSPRYWRKANGYPDDAAPTELEIVMQLLLKRGILDTDFDPRMTIQLFQGLGFEQFVPDTYINPEAVTTEENVEPGDPESTGEAVVTGAAGPRLGDFDPALMRDIQLVLDEGIQRAARSVDRRVKSEAVSRKAPEGFAEVAKPCADGTARALVEKFGRTRIEQWLASVTENGVEGEVARHLDRTLDRVEALVTSTQNSLNRAAGSQFNARPVDWELPRAAAMTYLSTELAQLGAELVLVGPPAPRRGETADVLIAGKVIREFMSVAGGGRFVDGVDGLLANGVLLTNTIREAGWRAKTITWNYGITPRVTAFAPHESLDGQSFGSWSDPILANEKDVWIGSTHYRPGDHEGCLCTWVVTWERDR